MFYASNVSNSSGGGTQRPNRIGSEKLSSGQDINHWFDSNVFAAPAIYTFGNSGTGILAGPGSLNVDLALERHSPIHDRPDLNFRAEAFNAFNHANFGDPAANIGNSNAGVISSSARDANCTEAPVLSGSMSNRERRSFISFASPNDCADTRRQLKACSSDEAM